MLVTAYEQSALQGRLDPPLLLVLDEAANIAPLRDLAQISSTTAGLAIQLVTIWQNRGQIAARYGQHAATVINNHRAKLALSGITDASTTRDVAQVIGDTDIVRGSTTIDADGRTSATREPTPSNSPAPPTPDNSSHSKACSSTDTCRPSRYGCGSRPQLPVPARSPTTSPVHVTSPHPFTIRS